MTEPTTPLMRQYVAIKKQHPSALLFFRLGDFYELFFDDAVTAARELQITLTSRNKESDQRVPMCGVPYHSAENYLSKLLRRGYKVAICEQMEAPSAGKKLVRREVTRVMTPGTVADASVSAEDNNFLAAVAIRSDPRSGRRERRSRRPRSFDRRVPRHRIRRRRCRAPHLRRTATTAPARTAGALRAAALRSPATRTTGQPPHSLPGCTWTPLDDWAFTPDYAVPLLENQFGVLSLEGFGLAGRARRQLRRRSHASLRQEHAAGRHSRPHRSHRLLRAPGLPVLDAVTVRNLELARSALHRLGAGRDPLPHPRCLHHAHGQALAALLDRAPFDRRLYDRCSL